MTTPQRTVDQAVEDACAVAHELATVWAEHPQHAIEVLDSHAFFLRGHLEMARRVVQSMAEGQRHAEARHQRELRLRALWLRRPARYRTEADIRPFFAKLLKQRRDLLPQVPHVSDVWKVVAPFTAKEGAR